MSGRQLLEMGALDEVSLEQGDPARRHRDVARRADATLEVRALTQQRAGAVLGESFAVVLDTDDTVEDQQHLRARLALLEQDRPLREPLDAPLAAALHHLRRERG